MNEIRDVKPELWNSLAERTVDELRKLNPTRKIIIGSTCWNSPNTLKDLQLFDDDNIIYTFHNYAPIEFTHQRGVLQALPLFYNRAMEWPGDIQKYREFRTTVGQDVGDYADCDRHCKLEYRENWMRDMISLLIEHGIPYCVWNYLSTPNDGNRFSLVDDDRREILSPRLLRIIQGHVS